MGVDCILLLVLASVADGGVACAGCKYIGSLLDSMPMNMFAISWFWSLPSLVGMDATSAPLKSM